MQCQYLNYSPTNETAADFEDETCDDPATVAVEYETLGGLRYVMQYCEDHAGECFVLISDPPATCWTVGVVELATSGPMDQIEGAM